jgi:hypothetical protein
MKRRLFLASMVLALGAAPAFADGFFDAGAQLRAFPAPTTGAQCFDGRTIAGVNRAGGQRLLVQPRKEVVYDRSQYPQPRRAAVYDLRLADDCAALDAAYKIAVRAQDGYDVCARSSAELVLQTAGGERRCLVRDVRRLTPRETAALATAARR